MTRGGRATLAVAVCALLVAGCGVSGADPSTSSAGGSSAGASPGRSSADRSSLPAGTPGSSIASTAVARTTPAGPASTAPSPVPTSSSAATGPAAGAPVVVIDPGHSPSIQATDPATGLTVSDYANEPEMDDVFAVAQLVATGLRAAGYRVVLTKTSADQRIDLAARARIATAAHADLALSIHDQAGASGGIGFRAGNNIVYYQSTGTYRATPSGRRVYFTDAGVAARSRQYGQVFARERQQVEGVPITLQGNTGYDLGTRGLAAGDIWIVQLLSTVPWIYNESGGNSAGQVGLNTADKTAYARALVASVQACLPIRR